MALKRKLNEFTCWENHDTLQAPEKEQPYSFAELVNYLSILKEWGYLYEKEAVYEHGREALWQENPSSPAQAQVTNSWQQRQVTEIVLHFRQLITEENIYLHIYPGLYPKKELCRTMITLVRHNPSENSKKEPSTASSPYFETLLYSMNLMPALHKWQEVSAKALQLTENDSLLTTMAKLRYTQLRVGRLTEMSEKKNTTHWVGEFVSTNLPLKANYLYLLVTHTDILQKGNAKVHCELTPKIHILSSAQALENVKLPGGCTVFSKKLTWEGLPFANYYDLPDIFMLIRTPQKEYEAHPDNLHEIFQNLYAEGYRYRRETAMVERTYDRKDTNFLVDYNVNSEYLAHNLYQLTLEFIHPVTYCRKVVLISPDKIQVRLCNGHWGTDLSSYYGCSFQDFSNDSRHFSDDPETKSAFCETEVFPAPLLQTLLEEHHLLEPDQISIHRLMENREFSHWFSDSFPEFCYWYGPEDFVHEDQDAPGSLEDISKVNKEKIARCRRIFRHLRYPLASTHSIHDGKVTVEIYTNTTRERAFFLIHDDYNHFVRFVDKYMDVNGALAF